MSSSSNRCEDDLKRRERAFADMGVTETFGDMSRTIAFAVGYDHRAFPKDCGGGGHGRHGMRLNFILRGPRGAVNWTAYMPSWFPGNVADFGEINRTDARSLVVPSDTVGDGLGWDLGYHSPSPQYDGQSFVEDCTVLPGDACYYDGSSLNAMPILRAFLEHGPHAVWAALARYYQEIFHEEDVRNDALS